MSAYFEEGKGDGKFRKSRVLDANGEQRVREIGV